MRKSEITWQFVLRQDWDSTGSLGQRAFACSTVHWQGKPGCKRNKRVKSKDNLKTDFKGFPTVSERQDLVVTKWVLVYASSLTSQSRWCTDIYVPWPSSPIDANFMADALIPGFCSVSLQWCADLVPLSSSETLLHQRKRYLFNARGYLDSGHTWVCRLSPLKPLLRVLDLVPSQDCLSQFKCSCGSRQVNLSVESIF